MPPLQKVGTWSARSYICWSERPGIAISAAMPRVCSLGDASHFLIVGGAAVAVVHHNFSAGERAQLFEARDEPVLDFQLAAAAAGQIALREMRAQIAHLRPSFSETCAGD